MEIWHPVFALQADHLAVEILNLRHQLFLSFGKLDQLFQSGARDVGEHFSDLRPQDRQRNYDCGSRLLEMAATSPPAVIKIPLANANANSQSTGSVTTRPMLVMMKLPPFDKM
jgi:hypothetical protein